jgi:hypothetical protein
VPLKDQVGGYRLLFSHNVEFGLSQAPEGDRTSMPTLIRILPCLSSLMKTDADHVAVLNMQESRSEPMVARRKSLRPSLLAFRLLESLEFSLWLLDHRTG